MNKIIQIIFGIVVVGLLAVITLKVYAPAKNVPLGSLFVDENAYSSGVSYTSSTMTTNIATSLLVRATSSRTFVKICNRSANTVDIYKQSTSTGIVVGMGTPLHATSTTGVDCVTYDSSDPYLGQVWGISAITSTLSIESKQE